MRAKCSGLKRGMPAELEVAVGREGVADAQVPRSWMPITSPGHASSTMVRSRARNCVGAAEPDLLAGAHVLDLHPRLEAAGADAHEGDPVAVLRVHVRLDLEDEAGEGLVVRVDHARSLDSRGTGGGASSRNDCRKGSTPKLVSALPK
jgi:hypothetical protein